MITSRSQPFFESEQDMRKLRKAVGAALVTGGLLIGGLAFAGPSAQAATNAPAVNAAWTQYRGINKTSEGDHSGDWVHCNYDSAAFTGHPRSYAEVAAQQQLGLLDHGGVAVLVVAECESEQVVGYLDGDEAAGRQTRLGKAVASPEQIMEPGREVAVVLSLGLL
jgi:hypothetical protein